ncbi:MAG: TylF/MycF/NovP-related O-methyltransferase [Geminicoccaceae bacterium]
MTTRTLIVKSLQRFRVNKLAHKIYYRYVHGFDAANRAVLPALERCFARAKQDGRPDGGDYMEFGLFKGYSFWYAQHLADRHDMKSMRFFGFDSFKGLPAPSDIDVTPQDVFYEGQYRCEKPAVVSNLESKGVDWSRTYLIEGFFDDSLVPDRRKQYDMRSVTIALIDCDLYASTRDVMFFLEGLIENNTILLFDDWNCFDGDENKGQRRAVRDFLARSNAWWLEHWFSYGDYGQVFIVRER